MKISRKFVYLTVLLTLIAGVEFASAKPKPKQTPPTQFTYSVVHAIPSGYGADIVDIYAGSALIVDNAIPGTIKSFSTSDTSVTIRVFANGVVPSSTTTPLLSTSAFVLSRGTTLSFVAHLTESESATITTYKDVVSRAGIKRSWMTVRHVAAAPAVQIVVDGRSTFVPLANTLQRKRSLSFGLHTLGYSYLETPTAVMAPTSFEIKPGLNEVFYLWGAKSKNNLAFLKQEVSTR